MREELEALAVRCVGARGYDGALAKDIYRALFEAPKLGHPNGYGWREDEGGWWLATGEDARVPPKTIYPPKWLTSIDAAMTLVPEGWGWSVDSVGIAKACPDHDGTGPLIEACGETPALALCAAALRARALEARSDETVQEVGNG